MKNFLADRIKNIEKSEIRKIFDKAPDDSINLGLGEIQFPTPKILTDYAQEILEEGKFFYTPNAGLKELREAISGYYNKSIPDNVCVTVGAEEAIFATLFSFINPGDEVLIANPTFLAYKTIIQMVGGIHFYFDLEPENNFKLKKDSFIQKISSKTKMVILNNPSNPLGICYKSDEINFIVKTCIENDILIVVDEVYRDLFLEKRPDTFLNFEGKIIVISGLSKSLCMTGWRIGWAISNHPELIKPIIVVHQYICTCAPYISQRVAIKALSKEGLKAQEDIRIKLKQNHDLLIKFIQNELPGSKILFNTSSPYLFINFGIDDVVLSKKSIEKGLIIIHGSAFGSNGKNWIRINYGLEKNKLINGLKKLRNTIHN